MSLAELQKPPETELIIITDGDEALEQAVNARLDSISYSTIQVVSYGDKPGEDINSRRFRISDIHNFAKTLISPKSEFVLSLEDDTTYPPDTLIKMLDTMERYEDCAFIEGVELGRRKSKYIGGWKANNIHYPTEIVSVMPNKGIKPIDAGGLYCALIKAELYRNHHFQPFDKVGTNGLSCDVNFGLWLRQKGYGCYIDHSIQCDHIGEDGSVNLGNTIPQQIIFELSKGKWISWPRLPIQDVR